MAQNGAHSTEGAEQGSLKCGKEICLRNPTFLLGLGTYGKPKLGVSLYPGTFWLCLGCRVLLITLWASIQPSQDRAGKRQNTQPVHPCLHPMETREGERVEGCCAPRRPLGRQSGSGESDRPAWGFAEHSHT